MGEKTAPAATSTSTEPLQVKALRDTLEHSAPPVFTHASDPISDPMPGPAAAPSPSNGRGADLPLAVEKAYFEQLIENAPEAISIVDQELRILRVNGEFTRLFGFTSAEAA
jgi:PAS domain-containing protein